MIPPRFPCGCVPHVTRCPKCCPGDQTIKVAYIDELQQEQRQIEGKIKFEQCRLSAVHDLKQDRTNLERAVSRMEACPRQTAARRDAINKVREAIFWLGYDLNIQENQPRPEAPPKFNLNMGDCVSDGYSAEYCAETKGI